MKAQLKCLLVNIFVGREAREVRKSYIYASFRGKQLERFMFDEKFLSGGKLERPLIYLSS